MNAGKWNSYQDYLASDVWREKRKLALERAGHRCQLCYSAKRLEVHHRTYKDEWGKEEIADLTALCRKCHERFTFKVQKKQKPRKYKPTEAWWKFRPKKDSLSQGELKRRVEEARATKERLNEIREKHRLLMREQKAQRKMPNRKRWRKKHPPPWVHESSQTCGTPPLGSGKEIVSP